MFFSSSQHYDIIASGVILNTNILRECIALMYISHTVIIITMHAHTCLFVTNINLLVYLSMLSF